MEINILGELRILKEINVKPNFSELQRKYGIDRHTIKKYYINGGKKRKERIKQVSKYEKHKDEAIRILETTSTNIIGVYEYLKSRYNYEPKNFNYNGFRSYLHREGIRKKQANTIHLRYETKPGKQLQVDWKESLKMTDKKGHIYEFNIFTSTLGFSRYHQYIYSKHRTTEDFIRCLLDSINGIGGMPEQILTDNMAAIVSIQNGHKKKHQKIKMFEKDSGIHIKLCKIKSPETKGKVESANRFLTRLRAYDYKFDSEDELIRIIKGIQKSSNEQTNQTTNVPPLELFKKEKEYLKPIHNQLLLDSYIDQVIKQKVSNQLLIRYEGSQYSVPKNYIGKFVNIHVIGNELYIYYNKELITVHQITSHKINYQEAHYQEGLKSVLNYKADDEVENMAKDNLKQLERI